MPTVSQTVHLWCRVALFWRKFRMEHRCCRPKHQRYVSWRFECRACVHPSTKWSYILLSYSVFKGWTGLYVQLFLFQNVWQGKPSTTFAISTEADGSGTIIASHKADAKKWTAYTNHNFHSSFPKTANTTSHGKQNIVMETVAWHGISTLRQAQSQPQHYLLLPMGHYLLWKN